MTLKNKDECIKTLQKLLCIYVTVVVLLLFPTGSAIKATAQTATEVSYKFVGEGTKEEPYLIENVEDLKEFRNLVNDGEAFENVWFLQTIDIDLESEEWTPIGQYQSGHYFYGTYDGGGHLLYNLKISNAGNAGLFGQLAGVVLNLGIESGDISGDCVGSIASHSLPGTRPAIIQCYSRATINGTRAGGIADNFSEGYIVRCWYNGTINGKASDNIVSYAGRLIECYADNEGIAEDTGKIDTLIPHAESEKEQVTLETQKNGYAAFVACKYVDYENIIPWKWNGASLVFSQETLTKPQIELLGSGTKDDPYLITSYRDLASFRDLVNAGYGFEGCWISQTSDIVMETDDWIPIGVYGTENYFWGIYNGNGHIIENLTCQWHGSGELDNNGLFGQLGGVVVNLGLADVQIEGECIGVVASSAAGLKRTAAILNCYTSGELRGNRPGGIADNFNGGTIANCISDVKLQFYYAENMSEEDIQRYQETGMGGITAVSADTKVYGCRTTANQVMPEAYRTATSSVIEQEELNKDSFIKSLNFRTALTQVLFANEFGVGLKQWKKIDTKTIGFSEERQYISVVSFFNEYLATIILGWFFITAIWRIWKIRNMQLLWKQNAQTIVGVSVISGIIAVFVDCAAIGVARTCLSMGNVLFILLINAIFFVSIALLLRFCHFDIEWNRVNWLLIVLLLVLLVLEAMQFGSVPRYDAGLYYGSFARGAKLFRLDLLTYIGAFVCWKWIQGSALLIAPFEFLMPGKMIGVYISNVGITLVTVVLLYRLYRECLPQVSRTMATISSFILVLCPFQLGMFTYLCWDTHCVYYAIWLLYAYKRKNPLLTAFCGYLLCFTKISGAVFYVVFLIVATIVEVSIRYHGSLLHRIILWWNWKRCIIWVCPGVLYLASMAFGETFVIQHFNGANLVSPIAKKPLVSIGNTIVQAFILGFRWLFVILIGLAIIAVLVSPKKKLLNIPREYLGIFIGTFFAGVAVISLLLLYNSDAECPRYTAIANVVYVILLPVAISILFRKETLRCIVTGIICVLLLVQTYWTIDPSIWLQKGAIDTGVKKLYRLALDADDRPGMNLGRWYGPGYGSVGDIYAYNLEYNFIDGLLQMVLSEIKPSESDRFYVLDVIDYEYHLHGNQYFIYWNTRENHFTYDGSDSDSILLSTGSITSEELISGEPYSINMGIDFYLVVSYRVDDVNAIVALKQNGYKLVETYSPKNMYGTIRIYHFER